MAPRQLRWKDDRMSILLVAQKPDGPAPDDVEPLHRIAAVEDGSTRREEPFRAAKAGEEFDRHDSYHVTGVPRRSRWRGNGVLRCRNSQS